MEHSWIFLLAMIGHMLCTYADRLLLCTPGGNHTEEGRKLTCEFFDKTSVTTNGG